MIVEFVSIYFKDVDEDRVSLTEALECPHCSGKVKLDVSYLELKDVLVSCPYCTNKVYYNIGNYK